MAPMWGHFACGLLGLLLAGWYGRRAGLGPLAPWLGFGALCGAILPDLDVLVAKAARAVTLGTAEWTNHIHRGPTHTLGAVLLLLLIALALASRHKDKPAVLFAGMGFGAMFLHIVPDTMYMDSVPVLWPFVSTDFGPYLVHEDHIHDHQYITIKAVDYAGEAAVYVLAWALAQATGSVNRLTRWLPLLALADLVFSGLLFSLAGHIDRSTFHAIAGGPRTLFVVVTLILVPWLGRASWLAVAAQPRLLMTALTPAMAVRAARALPFRLPARLLAALRPQG